MGDHLGRIGQTVGDYRLMRWLGGGGFGHVYLAEHTHDGGQVAIKELEIRLTKNDDFRAFLNEARTIRLRHAHIVPLLDFGLSEENRPFLVMEYAPQGTLRDHHPKGSRVPLPTIIEYATQVADALHYAHSQRTIHRDVKPENMLVRADGVILLSDFGIATTAHSTHSLNANQSIGGTIPYMAPEQLEGKPRTESDQYALGIVVYEWLAGRCPFRGTAVEVAMQHTVKPPPSLIEQIPDLPQEVEEVLFKALAKNPKDRFASMQAFLSALLQAIYPPTFRKSAPSVSDKSLPKEASSIMPSSAAPLSPGAGTSIIPPTKSMIQSQTAQSRYQGDEGRSIEPFPPTQGSSHVLPSASYAQQSIPLTHPAPLATPPTPPTPQLFVPDFEDRQIATPDNQEMPVTLEDISPSFGAEASSQPAQQQKPLSIRGSFVLERVRRGDVPSTWHVLLPRRRRLPGKVLISVSLVGFSLLVVASFILPAFALLFLSGGVLILLGSFWDAVIQWDLRKDKVLILLPEGIVYGTRNPWYVHGVINYREVTAIGGMGARLNIYMRVRINFFGKRWVTIKKSFNLSWLEFPEEGIQRITESHARSQEDGLASDL